MMVKSGAIEIIFKSHKPFQSYLLTGQADSAKKGSWDLKIISMAYIFTAIFIWKLVSVEMACLLCIQNEIQAVWQYGTFLFM